VAAALALEARRPGPFYAAAFALAFETATLFDGARALGRAGLHWLRAAGHAGHWAPIAMATAGALLALAGRAAYTTVSRGSQGRAQ